MCICMFVYIYLYIMNVSIMSILNVMKAVKSSLGRVYVRENFNLP